MSASHRRLRKFSGLSLAVGALMILAAVASAEVRYSITDLGSLSGRGSRAYGINESGEVVGYSIASSGYWHAFLYSSGAMADLGTLGGTDSYAYRINDAGQVVGYADVSNNPYIQHAFLYAGGAMRDIDGDIHRQTGAYGINNLGQVVGSTNPEGPMPQQAFVYNNSVMQLANMNAAHGINDLGQVVGWRWNSSAEAYHACIYDGASVKDLGTLGGTASWAYDVNRAGQVVGSGVTAEGKSHAFLYADGVMNDLHELGAGGESRALGINDSGVVVGFSGSGSLRAFVYSDGVMRDLDQLIPDGSGWHLQMANDINNAGQIVGIGSFGSYDGAFLLTPIPEPATLTLLAVGGLLSICRRKAA